MPQNFVALCFNRFFTYVYYILYAYALEHLKLHTVLKSRHLLDAAFTLVLNSALLLSKLLAFEFLLGISETFFVQNLLSSKNNLLVNAVQVLILFIRNLAYCYMYTHC
jgi:hypothetical protein